MNKAFVRETDSNIDYCPRCGSAGQAVGIETIAFHLPKETTKKLADPANFCPTPSCDVVYFDAFERVILTSDLDMPVYPKEPNAPMCACFGLTRYDIEQDVSEGVVRRVRAILERAKSSEARCNLRAANGQCCVPYVQKYYMQCKSSMTPEK